MTKQKRKQNLKKYRKDLAALKRAGLISQRIDARSHKPTRHMLSQIKQYRDVIDGRAKAVKLPSREAAREFKDTKRVKFDRVVVSADKDTRPRYDTKSGQIAIKRKSYYPDIDYYRQILTPQKGDELPILPPDTYDKVYKYGMPFQRGKSIRRIFADTIEELEKLMHDYDPKHGGRFREWKGYVEVLEFDREDLPEDEFEVERDFEDEEAGRQAYERRRKAKAQPRDAQGRFIKAGGNSAGKKTRKKAKGKARSKRR